MKNGDHIYLDYAAGAPLLGKVKDELLALLDTAPVNPSSIHALGRTADRQLSDARRDISDLLGCKPGEIMFTSGGTEANNLAILGLAKANQAKGRHIISCPTEHPSVLKSCEYLIGQGFEVSYLSVNKHGEIDIEELRSLIRQDTILITLMWVNNETGLVHPISQVGALAQEHQVLFHSDATQAVGHFPLDMTSLPVDAVTFSGHKLGALPGCGVLYLRKGTTLDKQSFGGSQENNLRAGTQNLPGAISLATALKYQSENLAAHRVHYETLMSELEQGLRKLSDVQINRGEGDYSPHVLNCSFPGIDGEALFIRLDMSQINVSNGAACSSGSQTPSHVLTAMGVTPGVAKASLRVSLGPESSHEDIKYFIDELELILTSLRKGQKV